MPAHHPQADLPVALLVHPRNLPDNVAAAIDDIVKETDRKPGHPAQFIPIHRTLPGDKSAQIERSQAAGLVRQQRLLPAGIGRLVTTDLGGRIEPVHLIDEDDPRIALGPGFPDDQIEHFPRLQLNDLPRLRIGVRFTAARVDQVVTGIGIHPGHLAHELVRNGNGKVEVVDLALPLLAADKIQDIGVVVDQ